MTDKEPQLTESQLKESKVSEPRRNFLVQLWGIAVGSFLIPRLEGDTATGATPRSESTRDVHKTIRNLMTKPKKTKLPADNRYYNFYLTWMEDTDQGPQLMLWLPSNAAEEAEALKFFETIRGFMLPLEEKPLTEKAKGSVNRLRGRKKRSPEERALIEELLDDIDNYDLWIAYGKWLENHGDLHGEFIKLSRMRNKLDESDPGYDKIVERYAELYFGHQRDFIRPLEEVGLQPIFQGEVNPRWWLEDGAVMELTIDKPGILPERAEQFFEAAPLVVDITFDPECVDIIPFAALPGIAQFLSLHLNSIELTLDELRALAQSPHLRRLYNLDLSSNELGPEAGSLLAQAHWLPQLHNLDLSRCQLGDDGLATLVQSPGCSQLTQLELRANGLTASGIQAMSDSPHLIALDQLDLLGNSLDEAALEALGKARFAGQMARLELEDCDLGPQGMAVIKKWSWPELWAIHLMDNSITNEGLSHLAQWPCLAQLVDLRLTRNELDATGIEALTQTQYVPELSGLFLDHNEIGDEGARLLANWQGCKQLDALELSNCGIGDAGIEILAQSEALQYVDSLTLQDNPFGLRGALALARSPYLEHIVEINLSGIRIPQRGRTELSRRFDEEALTIDSA